MVRNFQTVEILLDYHQNQNKSALINDMSTKLFQLLLSGRKIFTLSDKDYNLRKMPPINNNVS